MPKTKTTAKTFPCPFTRGRRRFSFLATVLPLMGFILFTFLTAGVAHPGGDTTVQEKNSMVIQQAATALTGAIPPLDASRPARVETFTFGLG